MKKIYHLTIVYDQETEEVEYLMESVEEESPHALTLLGIADCEDYFDEMMEDEELMKMIDACCEGTVEPGEA